MKEALNDINWQRAMHEEFTSLQKMKTWELEKLPNETKPITCRWVLVRKDNGKYKAQLVARGFEQTEGINYSETFSPFASYSSIRLIISIAASRKMKLMTFDVKTAFLHDDLEEEIYMCQPEGFEDGTSRVCKLLKSLYGLKQSPKKWNEKFTKFLEVLEFENTDDDPCIFYKKDKSIILGIFVYDGIIAGDNAEAMIDLLEKLNRKFEITYDTAPDSKLTYLGMNIKCNSNEIFVNQSRYTQKILERFKFDNLNPVSTPIEHGMVTNEENFINDELLEECEPYREAVGSLLYLANISRPDISFAVNYLSRFSSKPKRSNWTMVRRVFQYLKGTVHYGISFNGEEELMAYSDAHYGGDLVTR